MQSETAVPAFSVTFLGTGTSTGVPMIGCDCAVCLSPDPRNKRMRPSILVEVETPEGARRILVDTTPEMRLQLLRAGIDRVDAVLVTHPHADHIMGMDDIRQINFRHRFPMPIYSDASTLGNLRRVFDYCFKETQAGGGKPQLVLNEILPYEPFALFGLEILPLVVYHGSLPVLSFRFGGAFAYVTDVSRIPDETKPHLRGMEALVLGTVRYEPHSTHFGLYQAIEQAVELAPGRTLFTHLSHHFDHETLSGEVPEGIAPAYDGLRVTIPGRAGRAQ